MKKLSIIIIVAAVAFTAAGLGLGGETIRKNPPTSADGAPPGSIHNLPVPAAVSAVKSFAANEMGVKEAEVFILTATEKEWSDSCLGLGGVAELCAFAVTAGWEVSVLVGGEEFIYRTNGDGSSIRPVK